MAAGLHSQEASLYDSTRPEEWAGAEGRRESLVALDMLPSGPDKQTASTQLGRGTEGGSQVHSKRGWK